MSKKLNLKSYIDRPIEASQIEKYLTYFSEKKVKVITTDQLMKYTVKTLFQDKKRCFSPLFIKYPNQDIGHFVLLSYRHDGPDGQPELEYFDSLCQEPHPDVINFVKQKGYGLVSLSKTNRLQDYEANTCARFVCLRALMISNSLEDFLIFLKNHKTLSADEMVASIVRFI